MSSGVTVEGTGSSFDQTTSEAAVEGPGAGTATLPVEAPGVGPEVLSSGAGETAM